MPPEWQEIIDHFYAERDEAERRAEEYRRWYQEMCRRLEREIKAIGGYNTRRARVLCLQFSKVMAPLLRQAGLLQGR